MCLGQGLARGKHLEPIRDHYAPKSFTPAPLPTARVLLQAGYLVTFFSALLEPNVPPVVLLLEARSYALTSY